MGQVHALLPHALHPQVDLYPGVRNIDVFFFFPNSGTELKAAVPYVPARVAVQVMGWVVCC